MGTILIILSISRSRCSSNYIIIVVVIVSCVQIDVNNQHFVEFNHRVPVQSANILSISGDVKINQIRFQWCPDVLSAHEESGQKVA